MVVNRSKYVIQLSEICKPAASELGGKGASLVVLVQNGFSVPSGFIVKAEAFFKYLNHNHLLIKIRKAISQITLNNLESRSKELKELVLCGRMPLKISSEIGECLKTFKLVAVRSSASNEDSKEASLAGLHDSYLNVQANVKSVLRALKACWASLFNLRSVFYKMKKGMPLLEGMAVVVQKMIPAETSGTTFTVNPNRDQNEMIVEATWGLGEALVGGMVTPDRYTVNKETKRVTRELIGSKRVTVESSPDGTTMRQTASHKMAQLSLKRTILKELIKTCLKIETVFGFPQDIEWSVYEDEIWILQSRPITTLGVYKNETN